MTRFCHGLNTGLSEYPMKPFINYTCLAMLVLAVIVVAGGRVSGGIRQSHHDFSGAGWSGGEVCIVCHTPHNASTAEPNLPLWNRSISTATYTVYRSRTLDATPGQPSGASKLCLSCHDGTIAVDSFGGNTGSRFAGFGNLGTDLSRHHPISITYNSALATQDGALHDPAVQPSGLGATIAVDLLENDELQCSSCHDVHVSRNSGGCAGCHVGSGHTFSTKSLSLRKSNDRSALCLTCHIK